MESSRRAVEAYRRTRLVDGVTSDDDKVAPVYKLDEISSVIQSSSHDVVHEMVEYIFKRLDHKSPSVKQKTLRLMKFIVGKSGSEFKRETQRQSAAIRQLFHYQGQPDPLRGDSVNRSVRETARETITAIFASEEKPPVMENTRRRIEGFGSNNFDARPMQEKKTLLSEVVDLGTASIKQGLTMISNHYGNFNNTNSSSKGFGSYEAPNLRRTVSDRENYRESYRESYRDTLNNRGAYEEESSRLSYEAKEASSFDSPASPRSGAVAEEGIDGPDEEKLLDAVTPVGGVRLQPSREALQAFLVAAQKMNPQKLHHAFEQKLMAHSWQVRFKTLCFLEALLRQKSLKAFGDVLQLFADDCACIVDCTESPQNTLRDKSKKILSMLQVSGDEGPEERQMKKTADRIEMPDLIDTNPSTEVSNGQHVLDVPLVNSTEDLLGADSHTENVLEDDPFAGMAVHTSTSTATSTTASIFDGSATPTTTTSIFDGLLDSAERTSSLFEGLSVIEEQAQKTGGGSVLDLQQMMNPGSSSSKQAAWEQLTTTVKQQQQQQQQQSSGQPVPMFSSSQQQMMYIGALQSGLFLQQTFQGSNPTSSLRQQQQQQQGRSSGGGLDGFDFSSNPYSVASVGIPKMEETTKAFDFITDHVAAARTIRK